MFILDTNTLSDLFKDHARLLARMRSAPNDRPIVTTVISRIEILEGRFASIVKAGTKLELMVAAERLIQDEKRLTSIDVLALTDLVADEFEKLLLNKKLKKIGRKDLLIACFALAHDATLVTRNTKDFANIPGLKVENWAN